ncbi:MAG: GTP cyclohydrolase II [Chitinophagaceae bacterium]|nr:GTP cyclohydrolase II [Chitinophagaceae bacterium]
MLDSIESAIEDIKKGKLIIVVDDEDRENEGDFLTAAENATPEVINFMSTHGRGLICAAITEERCQAMARLPQLKEIADKFDLKLISIKDLIEYRLKQETLIKEEVRVNMPTKYGSFELIAFEQVNTGEIHLALKKGEWEKDEPVLVRVHSSCMTGDILGSLRCDCGDQLHHALKMVEQAGKGLVLYMNQEGRGIGLLNKLKAYKLQEQGFDTVEANLELGFDMDGRDYGVGAQILRHLGVSKMKLMSNNPRKRAGLLGYGLEVVENIQIEIASNPHNEKYLQTKKDKMGHEIMNGVGSQES